MDITTLDTGTASATASELEGKYLTFWTDHQLFGVSIADVLQIVGIQEITQIPDYPYYAKGIINLRGAIIPVIDVRLRLGKAEAEYNDRTCIIVTSIRDSLFGFIVDEVDEVAEIAADLISKPPQLSGETVNQYLTGVAQVGDHIVLAINTARLIGAEEFDVLTLGAQ